MTTLEKDKVVIPAWNAQIRTEAVNTSSGISTNKFAVVVGENFPAGIVSPTYLPIRNDIAVDEANELMLRSGHQWTQEK